ncbi:MAG TPA: phytanoyl-CoA dioxygenase family protein [Tepidisphaeraceae bacterium]|jgi:ectoine hydroxylase-related dioxygenase (phytanoyl-CoA dioxygenase family)|nr:phytanoyl-CoA dioxygenase family protein [Tepidisphaeraceae bacterium]
MSDYELQIERDGFAVVPTVVGAEIVEKILSAVVMSDGDGRQRAGKVYAVRDLLRQVPAVAELSWSMALRKLVEPVLGEGALAVRGILFDKTDGANWKVPWHQDLSIAVREKRETPGYGPWSVKGEIPHVQPPVGVLERMLTVRLHLDDCDEANGPLRVVPGSHVAGVMNREQVDKWRERGPVVECHVRAGGAVVMRPMILHASSPAKEPRHRRVIHIEYASGKLESGLEWFEALH